MPGAGGAALHAHWPIRKLRYMGSKRRLLPWIHDVLGTLDFETALDPFCGTGCVAYLMKAMGRRVTASDFLGFTSLVAQATIANATRTLGSADVRRDPLPGRRRGRLSSRAPSDGVFFTAERPRVPRSRLCRTAGPRRRGCARGRLRRAVFGPALKKQPQGRSSRYRVISPATTTAAGICDSRSRSIFASR